MKATMRAASETPSTTGEYTNLSCLDNCSSFPGHTRRHESQHYCDVRHYEEQVGKMHDELQICAYQPLQDISRSQHDM
jgi:hypothetical protein